MHIDSHPPRAPAPPTSAPPYEGEEPAVGERIGGNYEVLERLGAGAMGVVLRGRDGELARDVALKVLAHHHIDDPFSRECIMREARTLARVRHTNVVQIFAYEEWRGRPVLVMEYVPGGSLDREIDARMGAPVPLERVRELVKGMCEGVEVIHLANSVHRDLKPANVLIGARRQVKLADFGLAGLIDSDVGYDAVGTPAYMSPEALGSAEHMLGEGRRGDDLWALAVIAYELLTGVRPFGQGSFDDVMAMQLAGPPAPPSSFRGALPGTLDGLFARAFSPEPSLRPQRALEFAHLFMAASDRVGEDAKIRRIMVVDDDAEFVEWMCTVIESSLPAARVEGYGEASALFEAACAEPPDLIISDLDMPETDGHALTEQLRDDARTRRVPVVVLTASGSASDWQKLRDRGADAFLLKPIDVDTLAASLERALARSKAP